MEEQKQEQSPSIDNIIGLKLISGETIVARLLQYNRYTIPHSPIISCPFEVIVSQDSSGEPFNGMVPWLNIVDISQFYIEGSTIITSFVPAKELRIMYNNFVGNVTNVNDITNEEMSSKSIDSDDEEDNNESSSISPEEEEFNKRVAELSNIQIKKKVIN